MAEGKKSFVMYTDHIENWLELTDEEAGQLIKHVFRYVNDEQPETPTDRLIKSEWLHIRRTLKRDLEKFEQVKAKRSEAGKASAAAKANKKQQTSTNSTHVKSVEQASTNSTVNVNESVNVNENVNGSRRRVPTSSSSINLTIDELEAELKAADSWKVDLCRQLSREKAISLNSMDKNIERFCDELRASGEEIKDLLDAKKHFKNTLRMHLPPKQLQKA
jgi:hypothetical protein